MFSGAISLAITAISFLFMIIKFFSKNSTSYFKKEMETYYVGTERS